MSNLSDEDQYWLLGPRLGDEDPAKAGANRPWGKVVELPPGKSITAVSTDHYPRAVPWAIQLRFSLDGETYSPAIPLGYDGSLVVSVQRQIDFKSGPASEDIILVAGQSQPWCSTIARQLTITLAAGAEATMPLFVQCVVCRTTMVDCGDIAPNAGPEPVIVQGYDNSLSTRFDAAGFVFPGSENLLGANPKRRQFYIQNNSDTDLGVIFGTEPINWTGGSEQMSLIIPAGSNLTYESFVGCFRGLIVGSMKPGGPTPTGFILVTEGT